MTNPKRTQLRSTSLLAVAMLLLPGIAGAAAAQDGQSDGELIQGMWVCVAALENGVEVENYVGAKAEMFGDDLTWYFLRPDGSVVEVACKYSIDPEENPGHYDWYTVDKPEDVHQRLYVITENTLIWSGNLGTRERPENFTAGTWQFVMERADEE